MNLSAHFSLRELTKSQTATRLKLSNKPGPAETENLKALCLNVLEPVREHYGIPFSPSSGYRCPALNEAIGSSDSSQHIKGQAADFEVPGVSNMDVASWVLENCSYDQLILEFHKKKDPQSGWVHCSFVSALKNRKKASIFDGRKWEPLLVKWTPL